MKLCPTKGKPTLIWQLLDLGTLQWEPETIGAVIATIAARHNDSAQYERKCERETDDHEG